MLHLLISTLASILIGWILIEKVPVWLNLKGTIATIIKILGIFVIIGSLLAWV